MGTFFGLNIARLGMHAQHKALEVAAHNVANANTPGFSRQVSRMVTTPALPFPGGVGMVGSGVVIDEISRVRDEFLDLQIRQEKQTMGRWETRQDVLNMVERIFMEPSETGFSTVMGRFFDSWQEVSLSPEASSVRAALVQNASSLVNSIKHTHEQLKIIRSDIDAQIELKIKEVNTLAAQISDLNVQVVKLVAVNDTPADLMDRRDLLLDQLAEIIGFTSVQTERGSVNVFIGGRELVRENLAFNLTTLPSGEEDGWEGAAKVAWERDNREVFLDNGVIAGLQMVRDTDLRGQMEDFEAMSWGIINIVNEMHQQGLDLHGEKGEVFFLGEYLETLQVSSTLVNDLGKVAAAFPAERIIQDLSLGNSITALEMSPDHSLVPGNHNIATVSEAVANSQSSQVTAHHTESGTNILAEPVMMGAGADATTNSSILLEIVSVDEVNQTAEVRWRYHEMNTAGVYTSSADWSSGQIDISGAENTDFVISGSMQLNLTFEPAANITAGDRLVIDVRAASMGDPGAEEHSLLSINREGSAAAVFVVNQGIYDYEYPAGYKTGEFNFFQLDPSTGDYAEVQLGATFAVSLETEPNAAGFMVKYDPKPGDGRNALEIAQLRHARIAVDIEQSLKMRISLPLEGEEGTSTFESYYRDSIARLGVDAQESTRMAENQGHLLDLMHRRRDSYSGVAIDDEVAAMIQFQLVFQASARVITTLDAMYDTLINRMI